MVDPARARAALAESTGANPFDALSPDVAGWRRERLPELPAEAYFTLAPDWVCEVIFRLDGENRPPENARVRAGERPARVARRNPLKRTLEVYALLPGQVWSDAVTVRGDARVRVAPFDAMKLNLSLLWA